MATFPTTFTEINDYFNSVTPYLNSNDARLGVSAPNLLILNTAYDRDVVVLDDQGWIQLWPQYTDKGGVNDNIRNAVNTRRDDMKTILRSIYDDIPESALTITDRNTLNLPVRDTTPTAVPAVDFAPVISFEKVSNGIQVLRFQNPETPDSNAMPPNQGAEVDHFVGAAGIADNDIEFELMEDTGKHLLQANFEPTDKGKTAYYRARYKTDTGKTGPWSDVASEIVL